MTLPIATRTRTFSVNNRISFVSLNDTMANLIYGVKNFLVATMGYTVKYTCDGTTGPASASDHTDRLSNATKCTTRSAAAGSAQSFWTLTDGNGVDITMAYQGASDDIARLSFSPGGLFVPAGTSTNQPTATDEQVFFSATTIINATASLDRLWHAMASTDKKSFAVLIARNGTFQNFWGVEDLTPSVVSPAVFSPAVWGFAQRTLANANTNVGAYSANSIGGLARVVVSSSPVNLSCGMTREDFGGQTTLDGVNAELQGANGALSQTLGVYSVTSGGRGKLGNIIDRWLGHDQKKDGTVSTGSTLVHVCGSASDGAAAGFLLPWDGASTPQLS